MKKIYVLLLFLITIPSIAADLMPKPPVQKAPAVNNSTLYVQEGIKANQDSLHNLYFPNSIKPMKPQNPPQNQTYPQRPPYKPPYHPPVIMYGYERVTQPEQQNPQIQVINNNTYIYQNQEKENANIQAAETKSKSQLEDDERQMLKTKYSYILSNKTMTNENMCKNMALNFPNADNNELNRILNHILYLNCDIDKLR